VIGDLEALEAWGEEVDKMNSGLFLVEFREKSEKEYESRKLLALWPDLSKQGVRHCGWGKMGGVGLVWSGFRVQQYS
jgi:hypothetical protein